MNGNDTGGAQVSSREILTVIFRRRVPIIVCALIVTAAALSAAYRSKSVYDATAKVLLHRTGATPLTTSWTPFYGLEEEMNTEVEILTSEPVLAGAVDLLNQRGVTVAETVKKRRTTRPPTVRDIGAGVSAEPLEMSNIIVIRFRGADAAFVREAANAVAEAYVTYRMQVRGTPGVEEYFEDQLARVGSRLVELSKRELNLRKASGVYDREWQQRATMNHEAEIKLRLSETRARRVTEEASLAAIRQRVQADPNVLWPFPVDEDDNLANVMLTEYWTLHRDRDDRAANFTPSNPQVKIMDDRLAKMESRMREEAARRIKDKEYLIQDLRANEIAFESEIALADAEYIRDPDRIAEVEYLQKQIGYTYLHYDRLLEKMLDVMASDAEDVRVANAKVLSPAGVKMTKAGQMKAVYLVFSILLGMTLGIGFGFLLESLDHSVKSASDVEDVVGVPLLGSIPEGRRGSGARVSRPSNFTEDL
ncbi:MAG: Wzz/FepE/Etk N-terminal domain-containing protein [bacterium]